MGIAPNNNSCTERETLLYMVGNLFSVPYMVMGSPTGHGIQFQGMRILFNYICHRCELFLQSNRPSKFYEQLSFQCYLNGDLSIAIQDNCHDDVKTSSEL